ncbi:hypothetical protein GCM10009578_092560 [Streptomyces rhizosphaericus]
MSALFVLDRGPPRLGAAIEHRARGICARARQKQTATNQKGRRVVQGQASAISRALARVQQRACRLDLTDKRYELPEHFTIVGCPRGRADPRALQTSDLLSTTRVCRSPVAADVTSPSMDSFCP